MCRFRLDPALVRLDKGTADDLIRLAGRTTKTGGRKGNGVGCGMTDISVQAVEPDARSAALLAGAQFIDAFSVTIDDAALDARHAAEKMLERQPRWARALLTLRDLIVAPFGLKTSKTAHRTSTNRIGFFPVLSETPQQIVAGLNDCHLDFRLVVNVADASIGRRVTATTVVLTHNRLGRAYLAVILPFHRLIVRSMLRQVAA
jgi:hypothetical protein